MLFALSMYGTVFAAGTNVFTYTVGDCEVSVLVENSSRSNTSRLIGADEATLKKYLPDGTYATATNAFLVKTPKQIILVDTGFGTNLFQNMQTLGVTPDAVDAVLMTHMHGDHIGGLQRDGKPLFPKADVYLAEQELRFWSNAENVKAALAPYGERVKTFAPATIGAVSQELLPAITAIAAFGHTPGHTVYTVGSKGKSLLIWGDLVHAMEIQIPVPEVSINFDTDPVMAAATRKTILEYVAANGIPVAGMHLVYPGIGTIKEVSGGSDSLQSGSMKSFHFTPAE
jgi:glyoxylase-like metal-dependent hydrolase (beta-lactamase superfamily II)